jgi:5-methylcytosine-specific restriction endonuclease McrA
MKNCIKCDVCKPLTEFFKDKTHSTGTDSRCKTCKKEYMSLEGYGKWNYKYSNSKYHKIWQEKNKKHVNEYKKKRYENNPKLKLQQSIRVRINTFLKNKTDSTNKYLGCSFKEYNVYLEQQFGKNMSWENYGSYWEIDHIIPLSKGGSFHYTNTQPLTVTENRVKSNKI